MDISSDGIPLEIKEIQCMSEKIFAEEMSKDLQKTREVVVYVHGFWNDFSHAIKTAAQLASNMDMNGQMIVYAWPSLNNAKYTGDENNVGWTVPHFKTFLLEVNKSLQPEQIHIIAHSMGNRVLCYGLEQIDKLPLGQVIFIASDVDARVFEDTLFPKMKGKARRFTLYASSQDRALCASRALHDGPRAGEIENGEPVLLDGLDTIDVSEWTDFSFNHCYYLEHAMIQEIRCLITKNEDPSIRSTPNPLFKVDHPKKTYWKLLHVKQYDWDKIKVTQDAKVYYVTDRKVK